MRISTRGRYALRAMLEVTRHEKNSPVSLKYISEKQDISKKYLGRLFSELKKSGLLTSERGRSGGYMLGTSPAEIKIGDIIRAVEGPITTVRCVESSTNRRCSRLDKCTCHIYWERLENHIASFLDSITLLELSEDNFDSKATESP